MPDKYLNFMDLKQKVRDRDFQVRVRRCKSDAVIIAPHGGRIEPGTSEIAEAIAAEDYSFYATEDLSCPPILGFRLERILEVSCINTRLGSLRPSHSRSFGTVYLDELGLVGQ